MKAKISPYDKAVQILTDRVDGETIPQGVCAKWIRESIQKAFGNVVSSVGIGTAKDYGPFLIEYGYTPVERDIEKCVAGDVVIFEGVRKHEAGHIQMKCPDGYWRSDHQTKQSNPFADRKPGDKYQVYSRP